MIQILNAKTLIKKWVNFDFTKAKEDIENPSKSLACIVGRESCFETSRDFPIPNVKDALKAASLMRDVAPFDGVTYCLAEQINAERSRVYFFTIKEQEYRRLEDTTWFIFPEPLLLYLMANSKGEQVSGEIERRIVKASITANGFISSVEKQSGLSWMQATASDDNSLSDTQFSGDKYLSELVLSLKGASPEVIKQGFNSSRLNQVFSGFPWKMSGAISAGLIVLYLAISSAYLSLSLSIVEEDIATQREELSEVFEMQSNLQREFEILTELSSKPQLQNLVSDAFPVLLGIAKDQKVELQSLTFENDRYIVRAKADKATDIIETLANDRRVDSPEMTSGITKSRGKEIVTIAFRLKKHVVDEESSQGENEEGVGSAE